MKNQVAVHQLIRANEELANITLRVVAWNITTYDDLQAFNIDLEKVKYWLDYAKTEIVKGVSFT